MSIIRIKKRETPYVQIDKRPLEDDRLSWRAKGIFAYLLSKPDGWKVNIKDIWAKGTEGRNAVQVCMRELEKFGYAQLVFIKGDAGKIVGSEWVIIEEPEIKIAETPETGNPTNRQSGSRLINSNNEVLSNNKGEREAQAPNSHSQPEAEPSQFGEKEKQPIPFPKPPSQILLDARPGAKTPSELVAAMRKFYTDCPIEWSDGVLQLAKGGQYSEQKRQDIVTAWAAHKITQNQGSNTFAQLNASLQKWFRNQKDFDRQYGKPAEAAAPRNDNSKPLPAYVE